MISVVQQVSFSAGHRLKDHEGKCRNLHGHNYLVEFHLSAAELDGVGRVLDFAEIKQRLGGWIKQYWDHSFILARDDEEARRAVSMVDGQRLFIVDNSPTVETMSAFLLYSVGPEVLAGTNVVLSKVVMWETADQYCVAALDD
ncbi:MAG: 6-carboxytetrahydropterin synthase [Bdellovibrionales bacterium]|nr:6-carboxytetrahydropterin synthase [Bdellovibrionales bacterium]